MADTVLLLKQLRSITDLIKAGAVIVNTSWGRKTEGEYNFSIKLRTTPEMRKLVEAIWESEGLLP